MKYDIIVHMSFHYLHTPTIKLHLKWLIINNDFMPNSLELC